MLRNLCEVLQYCHTAQGVKLIVIGATLVPEFMYVPSTMSYGNEEEDQEKEEDQENEEEEKEEQEVEEGEEEDQENEEDHEKEEDNDEEDQEKTDVAEEEEEKKVMETSVTHAET